MKLKDVKKLIEDSVLLKVPGKPVLIWLKGIEDDIYDDREIECMYLVKKLGQIVIELK